MQAAPFVGIGQQDDEFLSAEPGQKVRRASQGGLECPGHAAQAFISCQVAVQIVVVFEMVDVDEQQGQGGLRPDGPAPFVLVDFVEAAAVGDVRQPVQSEQILQ